jgi:translation initiation factor IF-2
MLPPEIIETVVGEIKILGVFKTTKSSVVCGGKILSGKVEPKYLLRIKRDKEIIGEGKLTSLQREKQEVKEAFEGETCGLNVSTNTPIELDDRLEFYTVESRVRSL